MPAIFVITMSQCVGVWMCGCVSVWVWVCMWTIKRRPCISGSSFLALLAASFNAPQGPVYDLDVKRATADANVRCHCVQSLVHRLRAVDANDLCRCVRSLVHRLHALDVNVHVVVCGLLCTVCVQ